MKIDADRADTEELVRLAKENARQQILNAMSHRKNRIQEEIERDDEVIPDDVDITIRDLVRVTQDDMIRVVRKLSL